VSSTGYNFSTAENIIRERTRKLDQLTQEPVDYSQVEWALKGVGSPVGGPAQFIRVLEVGSIQEVFGQNV
jgi:hypothetical protein